MSIKDICTTLVELVGIGLFIVAMVLWVCWLVAVGIMDILQLWLQGFSRVHLILENPWKCWDLGEKKTKQKQGPGKFVNVNKGPWKVLEFYGCATTNNYTLPNLPTSNNETICVC